MPGLDAKSEVLIFRGAFKDAERRDQVRASVRTDDYDYFMNTEFKDDPNVTRIPLRYHPDEAPQFTQEDILLQPGNIVVIRSRDREKYYTGGLLRGSERLLPRDYDLDVLAAIALAGGPIGSGGVISGTGQGGYGGPGAIGGSGQGGSMGIPPSRAIILRTVAGSQDQVAIRVNLNRALRDRRERILIQPDDVIVVQYTFAEEVLNQVLSLVRINFLLNGLSGRAF